MNGDHRVLVFGCERDTVAVAAVTEALDSLALDVSVETDVDDVVEGAATVDCVVATSADRGREFLDAVDELDVALIVLTDDVDASPSTGAIDHGRRVRIHRADDLATLGSRIVDAVLADRARGGVRGTRSTYEELIDHQAAYRTLVNHVPDGGVALFDRDLRYTWVGGGVLDLVGLRRETLEGQRIDEVHSPEYLEAHRDAYRAALDGEQSSFEFTYCGLTFDATVVPVREGDEAVAGMIVTRDVTERIERQRDLLVKTRAMDAAGIGLCLTDPTRPDNPLVYVNEGYERMTGYDAGEVLGRNPRHLQGPATEEEPRSRMREAVENAEPVTVDITNYRKDGTAFVNHVEITPIFDAEGRLVHFLGSQVDVTEQYNRERTLARQNERLEEFASIVSHDIRSPLAVVRASLALARETGDLSNFDRAEAGLDRMSVLVEDLLALAREGRSVDPDDVEPTSVARTARNAWQTVATGDATLTVVDDVDVDADPSRLQQLFENLFRNSVEHGSTSPRSRTHEDSVEHGSTGSRSRADDGGERGSRTDRSGRDDAGTGVVVRIGALGDERGFFVEDDGPGIPAADRDRIFEAGVTTAEGGTGFGLAIVRRVAEAHGWTVRATERDGGGARFEVHVSPPDTSED